MSFADTNGVALGTGVQSGKADGFLRVFCEDEVLPGAFTFGGETLIILENAADLDLDAAPFAVAEIGGHLQAAIGSGALLDARAGDGGLHPLVHEDDGGVVLQIIHGRVHRQISAGVLWSGFASGEECNGCGDEAKGGDGSFHNVRGLVERSLTKTTLSRFSAGTLMVMDLVKLGMGWPFAPRNSTVAECWPGGNCI